ncbi:hypothetical protein RHGRI_025579 [Rhododendron griersonianum]|uniref:Transmembrane protein n=1 Tax=Rhododendron griersonianum TaxID=479676 RepID=A0AAV6IVR5_9ERIC|nr:hypothetical protein RHGRI_025579 [Rhododendron griersonianum]
MMRARFLWFTIGFTSAAAAMTHFVFQDLWADRQSLSSQVYFPPIPISPSLSSSKLINDFVDDIFLLCLQLQENFDAVDARVSNLEQVMPSNSTPPQAGLASGIVDFNFASTH